MVLRGKTAWEVYTGADAQNIKGFYLINSFEQEDSVNSIRYLRETPDGKIMAKNLNSGAEYELEETDLLRVFVQIKNPGLEVSVLNALNQESISAFSEKKVEEIQSLYPELEQL